MKCSDVEKKKKEEEEEKRLCDEISSRAVQGKTLKKNLPTSFCHRHADKSLILKEERKLLAYVLTEYHYFHILTNIEV